MPKVALADLLADWEQLLQSAAKYKDERELHVHLAKLQAARDRLHQLQALREELQARQQEATQQMGQIKDSGKIAAIEVRSLLKGVLGHSNERLVHFNIRPIRKRGTQRKRPAKPTSGS